MLTKNIDDEESKTIQHVDDFIDYGTDMLSTDAPENEDYARWVMNHFRLPAISRSAFDKFMVDHKLFCEYEGKKYRVTGCSRMGDVWLAKNFDRDCGYDYRVNVEDCSNWTKS